MATARRVQRCGLLECALRCADKRLRVARSSLVPQQPRVLDRPYLMYFSSASEVCRIPGCGSIIVSEQAVGSLNGVAWTSYLKPSLCGMISTLSTPYYNILYPKMKKIELDNL